MFTLVVFDRVADKQRFRYERFEAGYSLAQESGTSAPCYELFVTINIIIINNLHSNGYILFTRQIHKEDIYWNKN